MSKVQSISNRVINESEGQTARRMCVTRKKLQSKKYWKTDFESKGRCMLHVILIRSVGIVIRTQT